MKAFWQLLRKDLLAQRWALGILLIGTLALHFLLSTRIGRWAPETILGLGLLPFSFTQLWVLWISIQIYRAEWAEDTVYFLLSPPISSWLITSVKLLSTLLYTLFGIITMAASYLFFLRSIIKPVWSLVSDYLPPVYLPGIWLMQPSCYS